MNKYQKNKIIFLPFLFFAILTVTSFGRWSQLFSFAIVTLITFGITYLIYKTTYISCEDNIVEGKSGILKIQKLSSKKEQISSIKIDKGIFGRLFDFGTIYITTSNSEYSFKHMSNPDKIKQEILK